jgi:hypothetical protein
LQTEKGGEKLTLYGVYVKSTDIHVLHSVLSNGDPWDPLVTSGHGVVEVLEGDVNITEGKFCDKDNRVLVDLSTYLLKSN